MHLPNEPPHASSNEPPPFPNAILKIQAHVRLKYLGIRAHVRLLGNTGSCAVYCALILEYGLICTYLGIQAHVHFFGNTGSCATLWKYGLMCASLEIRAHVRLFGNTGSCSFI